MLGFSRLQVSGYRRLRNLDLELRPLNVLIGANGVGKSSVLEVVSLLAASAGGRLQGAISDAGGFWSLLTSDGRTSSMEFALEMHFPKRQPLKYQLGVLPAGLGGYAFRMEHLEQWAPVEGFGIKSPNATTLIESDGTTVRYLSPETNKLDRPNWDYKFPETALSQVPRDYRESDLFRYVLATASEIYHTLDVSKNAPVRLPQQVQPAQNPNIDGSLLVAALYTMRETAREQFEAVEDALRAAFPAFERLEFPPVASGMLSLAWKDRAFPQAFYPSQLSEGTLRFLWLATLLQSEKTHFVTLIDEPEVSLHPEMLRVLADLMREASQRTQLIVATHSDRFIRFLKPDELVICDIAEDGGMEAKRGSDLNLDAWLKEYTLDELWSMGRIGGRA